MTRIADFEAIKLRIASPEEILSWSHGEVTKPETINYRTQRAEKDGLFCEKIFGPTKDWECYCGKYKKIRYKGIICDKCGVEVTRSLVRRERFGHIRLATPVTHIWFLRSVPSKIGTLLDLPVQQLERVIYFTSYIVTGVNEEAKRNVIKGLKKEYKSKITKAKSAKDKKMISEKFNQELENLKNLKKLRILQEHEYFDLSLKYGEVFEAGTGTEPVKKIVGELDLETLVKSLGEEAKNFSPQARKKIARRRNLIEGFIKAGIKPGWMFITVLPIIPPELRPMVQLEGGRFATSDLNDLYRRVINRNNRLKHLEELNAPEVIKRNEKRILQEALDALIDNPARRGQAITTFTAGGKRMLKSLADMLKGKQGRFRQNLLGKRVDYSGRSVIVVGPELKLWQCGLPKSMALELFKPFVIQKIIENELAHNIRGAGRLIEEAPPAIWAILEHIIKDKLVLLNRAPTLHRLGVQAFRPVLIEGKAIQTHPLVCAAFNADFDGDQMAVHLPLSDEAQKEAQELMLSTKNLLKPATGVPIASPLRDIVLGCYWMTKIKEGEKGEGMIFSNPQEAILAYESGKINIKARIKVRLAELPPLRATSLRQSANDEEKKAKNRNLHLRRPALRRRLRQGEGFGLRPTKWPSADEVGGQAKSDLIETCVGRLLFNEVLPSDFPFINEELDARFLEQLTSALIEEYGMEKTAEILDRIKNLGFEFSTISGITWGLDDLRVPEIKADLISKAEKEVARVGGQYQKGLLTYEEKKDRVIEIWHKTRRTIERAVPHTLDPHGSVYAIISSGARGRWEHPVQMAGMKGLVANPAGEVIELPVKSSFKEGCNVLEYFISTHGARKGTTDTALRTATAGYLTRRLIDVSQDVMISKEDCKDKLGFTFYKEGANKVGLSLGERVFGRISLEEMKSKGKSVILEGEMIDREKAKLIDDLGIESLKVRSAVSCKTIRGVCQKCYGLDLGRNRIIQFGEAIGTIAAQSIGEPGTQLTMRTFHTGGVAGGGDITQGLPRAGEIFEARPPRVKAVISDVDGKVLDILEKEREKTIRILFEKVTQDTWEKIRGGKGKKKLSLSRKAAKKEVREYAVPINRMVWVKKGDRVKKGQQLSEGHIDLKELFDIAGDQATISYILDQIQQIYVSEGAYIHDKHIEVIIRQMFSRVRIKDAGDTNLMEEGKIYEKTLVLEAEEEMKAQGKKPPTFQNLFLGITKVALSCESFFSAASFQETSRVLVNAAAEGRIDRLRGLKENVIIGKLIPVGTGFKKN